MDNGGTLSLFPLHCSKTIHLVRHGQGIHNVEGEKNIKSLLSPEYFDAHLTPLGWQQVDSLHRHVHTSGLIKKVELVITSPLLRAIQTAVGVFGGTDREDDLLPLMVEDAGNSRRSAVSSLNSPPILAVELCREHLGVRPCDKRRCVSEYKRLFPAVDFSLVQSNDDVLWKADIRESNEEVAARGLKFFTWLFTRKEKEIAIVTHSGFLFHTLVAFGNECHPPVKNGIHFANCEIRSMIIIDKSDCDSSSTLISDGYVPSSSNCPPNQEKNNQEGDAPKSLLDEKLKQENISDKVNLIQ